MSTPEISGNGKPSRSSYDAIVIGGGHNGLTCAAYLAKAGRSVLVLERRHVLGGAAVSEELYPGFTFSVCSYVVSLFRPHIIRELDLTRHGLQIIPLEASFLPLPDGDSLVRWSDPERTRREIARFSPRDAEVYPEFGLAMGRLARFAKHVVDHPAPEPTSFDPRELARMLRLGRALREFDADRVLTWLESGEITHFFGVPAVYQFLAEHPDQFRHIAYLARQRDRLPITAQVFTAAATGRGSDQEFIAFAALRDAVAPILTRGV